MSISRQPENQGISFEVLANSIPNHVDYDDEPETEALDAESGGSQTILEMLSGATEEDRSAE